VSAPTIGPRPTYYPIRVKMRAIEHRRAGWTLEATIDLLEREFGHRPVQSTLSRWCDDAQHELDRAANTRRAAVRRAAASGGRLRLPRTDEFKLARMRGLRDAGLKDTQIAVVMAFDFGDAMSRDSVARALEDGRYRPGRA
jgi:hypothetical protein